MTNEPKHSLVEVIDPRGNRYYIDGIEVTEADYLAAEKANKTNPE